MLLTPLALSPALPSELLTYVLAHQVYPTTVVICQPRNVFHASLVASVPQPIQPQPPPPPTAIETSLRAHPEAEAHEALPPEQAQTRHPLLIPTLHQIATSKYVDLVFVPTVSHLRAYLSVFPPSQGGNDDEGRPPEPKFDKPGKKGPLLIVYGIVQLHMDTSEWSAQGLGNSVAGLVEAGWRASRRVVVFEERKVEDDARETEEVEQQKSKRKTGWDEKVPMLKGSARRAGFESEGSTWSGRTIEVGRIFARWFKFGRSDWDIDEQE